MGLRYCVPASCRPPSGEAVWPLQGRTMTDSECHLGTWGASGGSAGVPADNVDIRGPHRQVADRRAATCLVRRKGEHTASGESAAQSSPSFCSRSLAWRSSRSVRRFSFRARRSALIAAWLHPTAAPRPDAQHSTSADVARQRNGRRAALVPFSLKGRTQPAATRAQALLSWRRRRRAAALWTDFGGRLQRTHLCEQ